MASIGVAPADHEPKVSDSMQDIIDMIQGLIDKDFAYSTDEGDVYYRVRKKDDYGKLSNRNSDDMQSNTRSTVQGSKEDELDFALWKNDLTEGASWDSPWGKGRPGWHIECSAMSKKFWVTPLTSMVVDEIWYSLTMRMRSLSRKLRMV